MPRLTLHTVFALALYLSAVRAQMNSVTITNDCDITVSPMFIGYDNGVANPSPLASGSSVTVSFFSGFQGSVYAGSAEGNDGQDGATKVGFQFENNYYYILIDSTGGNFPVSVTPQHAVDGGFCVPIQCLDVTDCPNIFTSGGEFGAEPFPTPSSTPPAPPLYQCEGTGTAYDIVYCPGSTPSPPPPGAYLGQLHPNGDKSKCMDVRYNLQQDGQPVQIYDCNGTPAQEWLINRAETKVQLAGTNFCLDAGSYIGSGVPMKIWQCYDGLPQQDWYFTADNRIAVTNHGQCLDLTNGNLADSNQLQTWSCTTGNTNQIWTTN